MHTKQDLINALEALGVNPGGTLMVHLSYKAIGAVDGRGDTVLDALAEFMRQGLLVLPSHTWSNVGADNPVMDVLYTPTCVGKLTELFRRRPGVIRSFHPTHSVAALGADAEAFVSGEEHIQTPCGEGGVYYKLWERDAQILLLGVNFTRNTYIHGVEDWDGAEGTLSRERTDLYVIMPEGKRLYTPQYRHCAPLGSETFSKLEPDALRQGVMAIGRFGSASARLMRAKPLREMTAALLKEDSRYLLRY
ncbi:MAG: AAC(3) family N-acetyltransferase [Oscillospiraceae bacterium]|nr:AAC(3) family N-acetyltransferase [Oscillospiraceae bacterium]